MGREKGGKGEGGGGGDSWRVGTGIETCLRAHVHGCFVPAAGARVRIFMLPPRRAMLVLLGTGRAVVALPRGCGLDIFVSAVVGEGEVRSPARGLQHFPALGHLSPVAALAEGEALALPLAFRHRRRVTLAVRSQ